MKRKLFIFGTFILVMLFTACNHEVSVTVPKPELAKTTEYTEIPVSDGWHDIWDSFSIPKEKFADLKSGASIKFEFSPIEGTTYTRVIINDCDWVPVLLSDLVCSPSPDYITQYDSGSEKVRTKIAVPDYDFENPITYSVTINLTDDEINYFKEKGMLFTGNNYHLKKISIYSDKDFYGKDLSLSQQYALFADYRNSIIKKYSKAYNTPMIFITTEGRENVTKKEYYSSIIDVVNCDSVYQFAADGQVKVRGNSTADDRWAPNQKPLRIKFESKQNMLGLHGGKKYKSWVLLKAEGFNPMDYLGFMLAHEIYKTSSFDYYASDCAFVHVFINEEYKGQYLLCEQNQVNAGRVAVDENKSGSTSNKIGYMLELDNYVWEDLKDGKGRWFGNGCSKGAEDYHFNVPYISENEEDNIEMEVWGNKQTGVKLTDINGETRGCISDDFTLKNDVYSDSQCEFISKYTKNLWYICYQAIEKNKYYKFDDNYDVVEAPEYTNAKQVCEAVIDLESLCNEMILEELVRDNDVGAGSLYMAIDFTKPMGTKYNKFTFECPWDFNWAYNDIQSDKDGGKYWNGKTQYFAGAWQSIELLDDRYDRSHPWFVLFNKGDWFRQMLREKWNKIGLSNLKQVTYNTDKAVAAAIKDINGYNSKNVTNFVRNRVDYIEKYLWK